MATFRSVRMLGHAAPSMPSAARPTSGGGRNVPPVGVSVQAVLGATEDDFIPNPSGLDEAIRKQQDKDVVNEVRRMVQPLVMKPSY